LFPNSVLKKTPEEHYIIYTFHDLLPSDANFTGLIVAKRTTSFRVNNLEFCISDYGTTRAWFCLERLLCKAQAHGQHWPCFCHPVTLNINAFYDVPSLEFDFVMHLKNIHYKKYKHIARISCTLFRSMRNVPVCVNIPFVIQPLVFSNVIKCIFRTD